MFDLEAAIRLWKRQLQQRRAFSEEDIEELERHLRDDVARRERAGLGGREAFRAALAALGDWATVEDEYQKTYREKQRRFGWRHRLTLHFVMLKSYLKIALRNVRRHPGYALINVLGLSASIAVGVLILLYTYNVLTFDQFHEHAEDIYFVYRTRPTDQGSMDVYDTWYPMLDELRNEYPQIVEGVRTLSFQQWVQHDDQRFQETILFADPNLFQMFDFPLQRGTPESVFPDPNSIVLSEEMANKYFGSDDPIGQTLTLNFRQTYTVTGILGDIPPNSSLDFEIAVPIQSLPFVHQTGWNASFLTTFARLAEGTDPKQLEAVLPTFTEKFFRPAEKGELKLMPLAEYNAAFTDQQRYASLLLLIAAGILLIACINFTNLATARAMLRVREIGMRKVLGATRGNLIRQFMGEAGMTTLLALLLGLVLAKLLLPVFNEMVGMELALRLLRVEVLLALAGLAGLVAVIAGFYPALYLSRFQPASILKDGSRRRPGQSLLRSGLVVAQFGLSFVLLVGIGVMVQQLQYMKTTDLKFDRENVLVLRVPVRDFADGDQAVPRIAAFKQEIERISDVRPVSATNSVPGSYVGNFTLIYPEDRREGTPLDWRFATVDDRFFSTFDVQFLEGRNFSRDFASDSAGVILNRAALQTIGWETAEGRKMVSPNGDEFPIIGVVEDFHYQALSTPLQPLLHFYGGEQSGSYRFLAVKLAQNAVGRTLPQIQRAWQQLDPSREMDYFFVDEAFNEQYQTEENVVRIVGYAAVLAVLIACLGLLGLASFMTMRRTKEIGVRKVLGASTSGLFVLLARDFARLVLIAALVGAPVAYLLLHQWLQAFPYRTAISPLLFIFAGLAVLLIALATVSYQAVRAALSDPVDALRYE